MTAVQLYSNSDNFFDMFVYVIAFTFICAVVGHIYLYIDTYVRNINNRLSFDSKMITNHTDKIKNSNKRIEYLEGQIKKLTNKYEVHGQYISGIMKEINGLNHIYERIEEDLHDFSVHSHVHI